MQQIDWMEWAVKVRERADRGGLDLQESFGVVRMPRPAWHAMLSEVRKASGPRSLEVAQSWQDNARRRVCRLAAALVRVDVRTLTAEELERMDRGARRKRRQVAV